LTWPRSASTVSLDASTAIRSWMATGRRILANQAEPLPNRAKTGLPALARNHPLTCTNAIF
jgi:hypothetical protein